LAEFLTIAVIDATVRISAKADPVADCGMIVNQASRNIYFQLYNIYGFNQK
jgi:hypothetical protein